MVPAKGAVASWNEDGNLTEGNDVVIGSTKPLALACIVAIAAGCTSTSVPELAAKGADGAVTDRLTTEPAWMAPCEVPENHEELVQEVLDLVNEERLAEGLDSLVLNESLVQVAQEYACEMAEERFFSHENVATKTSPGDRLISAGYIYYAMGENLAAGHHTAQDVFDAWMASPGHRDNILWSDGRETGIAVRTGGEQGWYWVQEFADPVTFPDD